MFGKKKTELDLQKDIQEIKKGIEQEKQVENKPKEPIIFKVKDGNNKFFLCFLRNETRIRNEVDDLGDPIQIKETVQVMDKIVSFSTIEFLEFLQMVNPSAKVTIINYFENQLDKK